MIDDQQRFGQVKTVVRAAILLCQRGQLLEARDQVVSEKAAKEHCFPLFGRDGHQLLQQAKGVKHRQGAEAGVLVEQIADRRKMQNAAIRADDVLYARGQGGIQQRQERRAVGRQGLYSDSVT